MKYFIKKIKQFYILLYCLNSTINRNAAFRFNCCEIRIFYSKIDLYMGNACVLVLVWFFYVYACTRLQILQHCSKLFQFFSDLTFKISLSCYWYDCIISRHDASRGMHSRYNADDYVCTFSVL